MKQKSHWWFRFASVVMDVALIYSISILLQAAIWKITYVNFSQLFIGSFLLYYFLCYSLMHGKTVGKILTGIKVLDSKGGDAIPRKWFLREMVLKGGLGIIFPVYLLKHFFQGWWPMLTGMTLMVLLTLSALLLFVLKSTWWELLSGTRTIKEGLTSRQNLKKAMLSLSGVVVLAVSIVVYPYLNGQEEIKTSFMPKYPVTSETSRYAAFLKTNAQSPADYIFGLFDRYDIVVISERMHTEYTQYELITSIVTDPRFTSQVGNIFTECGSVSFQDSLHALLTTPFDTEDELNRHTAILQRNSNGVWPLWSNTNLFDLLKTVNKLNRDLPDSTKINWHFTDLEVDWRTMTHEKFNQAYTNPRRDSIMAAHVIQPFRSEISRQRRHKALVIMNTRHGYGLLDQRFCPKIAKEFSYGTTAYLMRAFPGRVANVMMNTVSIAYGYMFTPVQNGKWETSFSQAGNKAAGFDLKGSPFGDDHFDVAFFDCPGLTYKDIFTGFVFYQPLEAHLEKDGFPFEFDHFEDTILRRAALVSEAHKANFKGQIARHREDPTQSVFTDTQRYAVLYNLTMVMIIPGLLLLGLLMAFILFGQRIRNINKGENVELVVSG